MQSDDEVLMSLMAHADGCSCSRCRAPDVGTLPCACGARHQVELEASRPLEHPLFNPELAEFAEDEEAWKEIKCRD